MTNQIQPCRMAIHVAYVLLISLTVKPLQARRCIHSSHHAQLLIASHLQRVSGSSQLSVLAVSSTKVRDTPVWGILRNSSLDWDWQRGNPFFHQCEAGVCNREGKHKPPSTLFKEIQLPFLIVLLVSQTFQMGDKPIIAKPLSWSLSMSYIERLAPLIHISDKTPKQKESNMKTD